MCQQNIDMHLLEYVLEIILAYDEEGKIVYDNAAAREKLGYDQGMGGLPIGNVFPGMFHGKQISQRHPCLWGWRFTTRRPTVRIRLVFLSNCG